MTSRIWGEVERSPKTIETRAGKSTTMPAITAVVASVPDPKISRMTGAIAISGTDRISIATGMIVFSAGLDSTMVLASTSAAPMPATKPIAASPRVVRTSAMTSERCSPASSSVTRYSHTTDGPLPTNSLTSSSERNATHTSSTMPTVTTALKSARPTPVRTYLTTLLPSTRA
ncbi:unannotated protein [freshwater metagenome]|uniref:Unannotated protein n=1 Tax=freshwater metagenome TaxID=449393 RepID=A0A6J6SAV4_9ZZZZ